MRELGMICQCDVACFCTFYASEMDPHSYIPLLYTCLHVGPGRHMGCVGL